MQKDDPLKLAAEALAKATPDYAGKSAYPPQEWWMEGDELVVLCADGRKVRQAVPPPEPAAGRQAAQPKAVQPDPSPTPILPMPPQKLDEPEAAKAAQYPHVEIQDPGSSIPGKTPAKHKAGK
jgi:hypothetical protein